MRNKFVSLQALALLVIFCLTGSLTRAAVNPKPFVVPELKQWTGLHPGKRHPNRLHFPKSRITENSPNVCRRLSTDVRADIKRSARQSHVRRFRPILVGRQEAR